MSTTADHSVEVRRYIAVFGALMALTLITVAVSYLDMPVIPTVVVAIAIASVKAGLVAAFFMHLKSERAMIYWPLALTMVLFVGLLVSVIWSEADHLFGTRFTHAFDPPARGAADQAPGVR
jgi:cytochrome c oxidase subunit 4